MNVLTSQKVQSTHKAVSDTLGSMLCTMNGKSPHFVGFMVEILKGMHISNFEIIGMFQSPHIPESTLSDLLAKEMELNEHDLRHAWMKNKGHSGHDQLLRDKEADWFFAFCSKLGFPTSCIIRMMHNVPE